MKKLLATIVTLTLILSLTSCEPKEQNWTNPGDTIYQSESVSVTQVEEGATQYVNYQYAPMTEEKAFNENKVIFTGTASNIRYIQINYTEFGGPRTDNITLVDISVEKVIQGERKTVRKTISSPLELITT